MKRKKKQKQGAPIEMQDDALTEHGKLLKAAKAAVDLRAAWRQTATEDGDTPVETQGDALATIAALEEEGGHEALKLVGDIMEQNTAANLRALQDALKMEENAHRETRDELRVTRAELNEIKGRVEWLLGGPMTVEMEVKIEMIAEDMAHQVVENERTVF